MTVEISDVLLQSSRYTYDGAGLLLAIKHAEQVLVKRQATAKLAARENNCYVVNSGVPSFTCNMLTVSGFYVSHYAGYAKRYFKDYKVFWDKYYYLTAWEALKAEELRCACVAQYLKYLRKKFKAELAEAEKDSCD